MFKSYFLVNNYFMQMRVPLMQQSSQKPESIPINEADQLNNSHSFSKKKKKIGSLNSKDKKNKKRRFSRTRLTRQFGFRSTPARYCSTVESGWSSLLCETSLHARNHKTQAFAQITWFNSQLGTSEPGTCTY